MSEVRKELNRIEPVADDLYLERSYTYQPDTTRPRLIQALSESDQVSESEEKKRKFYPELTDNNVQGITDDNSLNKVLGEFFNKTIT